jgi:hypothetical protein
MATEVAALLAGLQDVTPLQLLAAAACTYAGVVSNRARARASFRR